jgi:hypothetical protein
MAEDSHWFKSADQLATEGWAREGQVWVSDCRERYVPLYEAKMIHHYDHRWATYEANDSRDVSIDEKNDHEFDCAPKFWVPESEVSSRLKRQGWVKDWLFGWRKITNTTNERTLISAIFPKSAAGDSLPLSLPDCDTKFVPALCANFCSLVTDFVERRKLGGTNLTFQYLFQLPILPPSAYSEADLAFIVPHVLELTYTSHSMAPFARDLGYDGAPFAWDEDRRAQLRAELDAWYALAYGLTRDELRYVLDPKDVMGEDYPSETFRVLQKNEIAKYGEYRTQRLVLAAYDVLSAAAPVTAALADNQWQGTISEEADVRLLLAAILKRMDQPRSSREVRAAFLYAAQPHLLMPHVNTIAKAEWQRLVGDAASLPVSQSVPTLSSRQLAHFGTAQAMLAARNAWRYDAGADLVDRGAAIYDMVLPPWAEGRADFVWHALRSIDLSSPAVTTALSQGEQSFVAQSAAA